METFYFYHSLKQKSQDLNFEAIDQAAVWETCLRKIIFPISNEFQMTEAELFVNENALIFLISVLCGLKSKVIGETEIFGQFKMFLETEQAKHILFLKNQKLYQYILKEVKEIRDLHINNLGLHSYGSIIRKKIDLNKSISILGNGQLSEKIRPWFKNYNYKIHVRNLTDNLDKNIFFDIQSEILNEVVIIAAPVSTKQLVKIFDKSLNISKIIDCRSLNEQCSSLKLFCQSHTIELIELDDLFNALSVEQEKIHKKVPEIIQIIGERNKDYFSKPKIRPLGWDDLCI